MTFEQSYPSNNSCVYSPVDPATYSKIQTKMSSLGLPMPNDSGTIKSTITAVYLYIRDVQKLSIVVSEKPIFLSYRTIFNEIASYFKDL